MAHRTLKDSRIAFGLTQAELATRAKVDQTTISKIEAGVVVTPSHRTVKRICAALGVAPEQIAEFAEPCSCR